MARWPSLCWAREPCCPRPWVAAERTGRMSGGWERWVLGGLGAPGVRPSHRALAHAWGPSEPCSGHLAVQDRAGHPAAHRAPPPPHHLPSPIRRLVFPRPSSASRRLVSLSCSQALPRTPGKPWRRRSPPNTRCPQHPFPSQGPTGGDTCEAGGASAWQAGSSAWEQQGGHLILTPKGQRGPAKGAA